MHQKLSNLTERVERALRVRVLPACYGRPVPVAVAALHLPGEPVPAKEAIASAYQPFRVGQAWGRPWGTTWFRFTGELPGHLEGRRIELLVDLGFGLGGPGFRSEGLAYSADAAPIKGVQPRTAYVPITRSARAGQPVEVYLEAAANPRVTGETTALGDPATLPDSLLYRLERAELAAFEEEVFALGLDLQVLHGLAETLPETDPRRHQIRRALELAVDVLDTGAVVDRAAAARRELAGVLASPAVPSAHRVSAVGHAHIDSAWLWPVRETIRKCARTFSNVAALAEDYPELVFACSSAQQYAWVRDHHPEIFRRIGTLVADGRFVPVGGMWVESDTNLPGGEALVRQFSYGKRFFAEEFGVEPREVWLPDSFGYSAALPQLARLAGFRWFLTQKISWNATNRFPHSTFWWEGIDGTRIFTHFPPGDSYNSTMTAAELSYGVDHFAEHGRATRSLVPFGYGNGGGGPTREMLEIARRVADLEGSPRVRIEPPAAFFAAAEAEYADAPVWAGELYLETHRGTYTSQSAMKRGTRRTEHLLREAELWSATAAVRAGLAYPYDELDDSWRELLLLQFHDILPGSSIAWVHREARESYTRLAQRLEGLIERALHALAGSGTEELAFNAAPHQRLGVPALGAGVAITPDGEVSARRSGDGIVLDNGLLRVTVAADGTLGSIRDLVADREVLAGPGHVLHLHPDRPNRFEAWDIDEFYRHTSLTLTDASPLQVTEEPDRASVRVLRHHGDSAFAQEIALRAGERLVRFATEVDWHERESVLKVAFPLAVHAATSAAEIQFGHLRRPTHTNTSWDAAKFEICAHRWLHVGEPGYGVALVNDGSYGHEVTRPAPGDARGAGPTTVRLSLLRSPRYPDPDTDQGQHRFTYALACGAGIAGAVREGYRLNLPLRRRRGSGPRPPLVEVGPDSVLVESVKLADDRSGDLVVRLYEALGGRARARVRCSFPAKAWVCDLLERDEEEVAGLAPLRRVDEVTYECPLGPFQVVTLRLRPAGGQR